MPAQITAHFTLARHLGLLTALAGAAITGCASSKHLTCPQPVGEIVRDDCEQYRVQYDSLGVKLGASALGVVGANVEIGKTASQSPTELVQVMAHQATSLCRDFNACRLTTQEYLQRRETLDRKYAIAAGVAAELKNPALDSGARQALIARLTAALGAPSSERPAPTAAKTKVAKRLPPRVWFGMRHKPPAPDPVAPGFPQLVWHDEPMSIRKFFHKPPETRDGYIPTFRPRLYGVFDPDDIVTLRYGADRKVSCITKQDSKGEPKLIAVSCAAPDDQPERALSGVVEVEYERGETGERKRLGRFSFEILERPGDKNTRAGIHVMALSYEARLAEAWIEFNPADRYLPAKRQRPVVQVNLRVRKTPKATMRCDLGGKTITGAIRGRGGEIGNYQDLPRYEDIVVTPAEKDSTSETLSKYQRRTLERGQEVRFSRGLPKPFVSWRAYEFALPFVVPVEGADGGGEKLLADHVGDWSCKVSLEGELVRVVRFTVTEGGGIALHPKQAAMAGGMLTPRFLIELERHSNDAEAKLGDIADGRR